MSIYKAEDCEFIGETVGGFGEEEYWLHKPSGKTIIVPIHIERNWKQACEDKQ